MSGASIQIPGLGGARDLSCCVNLGHGNGEGRAAIHDGMLAEEDDLTGSGGFH